MRRLEVRQMRMMNFKKWVSYELISKKLLSARPFSFFDEELSDEGPTDRGTLDTASQPAIMSVNTPQASNTQVIGVPVSTHVVSTETSDVVQKDYNNKNSDLLTKLEGLQIKFLRLIHRIGFSPEDLVVSQVLYRLQLGTLIRAGETDINRPGINIAKARAIASEQEATDKPNLDFSLRILVLGKTGVGKSATLNSLLDQTKAATDAFHPTTNHIQEVYGTIKGIKVSIIDTPGLSSSGSIADRNRKVLLAIRRFIRKSPPDIVLYFERLDFINRGYSNYPLLKLITETFGSSIWFNTILVMTHSSSPLPEGPDGNPVNYDAYVHQCKSIIQHYIRQTVSNMQLDIPVSLVENHPLCRKNTRGEKILPNGKAWLSQLLLLCLATKVLGDANSLLKFQESFQLAPDGRLPSLPHLLSSILRTRSRSGADDSDEDMNDHFDDNEEDYDKLPAFRRLSKAQFHKLSDAQRSAYLDELYYRETLYLKKQWKEDLLRRRECIKSDSDTSTSYNEHDDTSFDDAIQVSDMSIPLRFDSDYPSYRYRCLLGNSRWIFRPVLDPQGWDRDVGFDGVSLEGSQNISVLHTSFVGQMSKDKEDFNVQTECAIKYVHPKSHSFVAEVDIQTAGRELACTVSGDAKFYNCRYNKTGGGLSVTKYGNNYFFGAKVEDSLSIGKRIKLTLNTGQIRGCGQAAHGGNVEVTLKGRDYPVREDKMTLGTTILCFDKEMVIGASVQCDFRIGRAAKMSCNANLNSRRLGQVSIKTSTSDHMEIALVAVISLFNVIFRRKGKDIAN